MKRYLSNLLLDTGLLTAASPIFLYWFIHGDYDRYIGIINGPYPFSSFGSGPFQMLMFMVLFLTVAALVGISMVIRRKEGKL